MEYYFIGKIIDRIVEVSIESIEDKAIDKKRKSLLKKYVADIHNQLLEIYGTEEIYDDLCRVILEGNNLERLIKLCANNDYKKATCLNFIETITEGIENTYNRNQVCHILKMVTDEAFKRLNQLKDPDHVAIKNIIGYHSESIQTDINKLQKEVEELQGILRPTIKSKQDERYKESKDICKGCKKAVTYFVGREKDIVEINRIVERTIEQKDRISIWIYGIGGMGKTQLCRKVYKELNGTISYIGWVEYENDLRTSLVNSFRFIDRKGNLQEQYEFVIDYLNSLGKDAILFIDNYDGKFNNELEKLRCHIILSSRVKNSDMFDGYKVGALEFSECKTLFKYFYKIEDNEIINEIIHMTGYLTLAIELVAKIGQKRKLRLEKYYEELKEKGFNIKTIVKSNWDNTGEELNVALSQHFSILFDIALIQNDLSAMYILQNFSVLPYLGINHEKVLEWFHLDEEENALLDLVDSGWIQCSLEYEYMMHPIISYTIRENSNIEIENCKILIQNLTEEIALTDNDNYLEYFFYMPYALSVAENFLKKEEKEFIIELYIHLATLYQVNGEYEKGYQWAFEAKRLLDGNKKFYEKPILKNKLYNTLAEICLDMRNKNEECKKWADMAVQNDAENKKLIGELRSANSFHNLACAYIQLNENEKSMYYEEIALDIRKKYLEKDNIKVLNAKRNLAMVYRRTGKIEDAYRIQRQVIETMQEMYKDNLYHPNLPVAYNIYSFILKDKGDIESAIYYQEKAVGIREKNNINDPKLAINYNNLGMFNLRAEKIKKAKEWQEKAIEIDLKFRGSYHNDLAMDYFNYAKILKKTGEEEKELQYLQKSKEIYLYNENLEEVERIEEVIREILENNENKY